MSRLNQCRAARSYPKCKCFICQQEEIARLENRLKPLRELAIAIDELDLTLQSPDFKWLKAMAREALKGGTNGTE